MTPMVRNFYQTEAYGVTSIVIAATPGKARYATFLAMRDAGYRVELCGVRISVRRRRDMDGSLTRTGGIPVEGKCLAPELFANGSVTGAKRTVDAMFGDGHCALCGKPATHVCHCPHCEVMLAEDGDDPDEGRPMCSDCGHCESYAPTPRVNLGAKRRRLHPLVGAFRVRPEGRKKLKIVVDVNRLM